MQNFYNQVPNSLIPETKYYMFLSFKEDPNQREVTFGSGKEIVVATTPSLMFVQADRGIYKPSTSKEETIGKREKMWKKMSALPPHTLHLWQTQQPLSFL